ncbi:prolyl aminopeptidase [Thalassotalea crassostreae]|uniref:prolyl aminopeptidase n=1 Tax=Thalassotalea crassostreae TaxID=1763536 RepID=UPI0008384C72|nr:prolyl aminopeptidase [Thalassotalea crassostreae]
MRTLYPKIKPNKTEFLTFGRHNVYIEECGNPNGIPVIYLHGGPGGGSSPDHRRYFDPEKYRIILFDQRGCGNSTPHNETEDNTTDDLIDDIEEIREHFAIKTWLVCGGSWGTTLALAYGIKHADKVLGFILRGIFLGTDEEVDWLIGADGAANIYPEHYQDFISPLNDQKFADPVKAYHKILHSNNDIARIAAAKAWSLWETRISALRMDISGFHSKEETHGAIAMATLENHYFINHCFFEPNYLLNNVHKVAHLPAFIIHGRYDMVCQLKPAYLLAEKWQNSELQIIPACGHSGFEEGIVDAICKASDKMASFLENKEP